MNKIIEKLKDKDEKKTYQYVQELINDSTKGAKYYSMIDDFASLLSDDKSYTRVRAALLICAQARWDNANKIKEVIKEILVLLHDEKPTVVRQVISALKDVVVYLPELRKLIKRELTKIDLTKYKDSMSSLIQKDIDKLKEYIDIYDKTKMIDIYGKNYAGYSDSYRDASRAVIVDKEKITLTHELKIDRWMIPGGGVEKNETLSLGCAREAAEELGTIIKIKKCYLIINEYYENRKWTSFYFDCKKIGTTKRKLTKREKECEVVTEEIPLGEALAIFGTHNNYDKKDEVKRSIYFREFQALTEYIKYRDK